MRAVEADKVFSKIDFQDDIDYYIYPRTIYKCLICKNQLSFNLQNFKKYSLNKASIFTVEEQKKIIREAKIFNKKEPNSFIDFYCPKCNIPTRIYFTAWAGGRFTGGYHLEFIVIDTLSNQINNP